MMTPTDVPFDDPTPNEVPFDDVDEALPTITPAAMILADARVPSTEPEEYFSRVTRSTLRDDLKARGAALVAEADRLAPVSLDNHVHVNALLERAKAGSRLGHELMDGHCDRAHKLWKGLCDDRNLLTGPFDQVITRLGPPYARFISDQKARDEAARKAKEDAARQAEEARLRAEAEARAADAKRLAADAAATTSADEADVLTQQATQAAAEAEQLAIDSRTVQAPVLPLERTAAPPKHVTVRDRWTWELTDKMALIKAVALGTVSPNALEVNSTWANDQARSNKNTITIPGLRIYNAGSVAHRK